MRFCCNMEWTYILVCTIKYLYTVSSHFMPQHLMMIIQDGGGTAVFHGDLTCCCCSLLLLLTYFYRIQAEPMCFIFYVPITLLPLFYWRIECT